MAEIAAAIRKSREAELGRRTDHVALALHALIDYSGADEAERRAGRTAFSRDSGALSYVEEEGYSPDEVFELFKKRGEGLDAWYRRRRESRQGGDAEKPSMTQKKKDAATSLSALVGTVVKEKGDLALLIAELTEVKPARFKIRYVMKMPRMKDVTLRKARWQLIKRVANGKRHRGLR